MFVYYIKRRSGDIAVADLRNVEPYEKYSDDTIFCLSEPIKEQEYEYVKESLLKGINKKIIKGLKEKHALYVLLFPVFLTLLVFLTLCGFGIVFNTGNLLLLFGFCMIVGFLLISSILQNTRPVKIIRNMYINSLENPIFQYSDEISRLEGYYQSLYEYDLKTLATLLAEGKFPRYEGDVSKEFIVALGCYINDCNKPVLRYVNTLKTSSYNVEREREHIQNDTATGLLDIHLLAFYMGMFVK